MIIPKIIEGDPSFNFLSKINDNYVQDNAFDFLDLNNIDSPYLPSKFNCKYIDEADLHNDWELCNRDFILSFNIQSLNSKFNQFKELIYNLPKPPLAILLQETWNTDNEAFFTLDGFHNPLFKSRSGKGGGVGIYIRSDLEYEAQLSPFHERVFESLSVNLTLKNQKKLFICNIYRPNTVPANLTASSQFELFIDYLNNLLDFINDNNLKSVIGGDFNLDLLKTSTNPHVSSYINSTFSSGFLQTMHLPTRIQNQSASCIDHFLTNLCCSVFTTKILISSISDHFPIAYLCDEARGGGGGQRTIIIRDFSEDNIAKFKNLLSQLQWGDVISEKDCSKSYDIFLETFLTFYNSYFPPIERNFNKNFHKKEKWVSKGILISRTNKLTLQKVFYNNPTPENSHNFRTYRNLYNRVIREAKKLYYHQQLDLSRDNPKKAWSILNEITCKKSKSSLIESLNTPNGLTSDPTIITDHFNVFYTNIANDIAAKINPPNFRSPLEIPTPPIHEGNLFNMSKLPLQQAEIRSALDLLLPKNSKDYNDLSMNFIKKIFSSIERPLLHIFRLSISNGTVPDKLKIAKISPVFKNGDKLNVTNYRPISLLSNFAKILEKIVYVKLSKFLESNNLLSSKQFGFRPSHSTSHPSVLLLNFLTEALNKKLHAAAIFCDLAKAFDTCDHSILLHLMKKKGIQDTELSWFNSYLSNRTQFVSLGDIKSNLSIISLGVPQGSILGPLLFLIYIDDLPDSTNLPVYLFADDTVILACDRNLDSLIEKLNTGFRSVCSYFRNHKLSLNPKKTEYIIFSSSQLIHESETHVFINNNNPEQNDPSNIFEIKRINLDDETPAYKYLGVFFDPNLNFKFHIQKILSKLNRALYTLRTVKNFLPKSALKSLYYSLFHCHLVFASEIWSSTSESLLNEISKKQKMAIRIITNEKYNAHTRHLFKQEDILPFDLLIQYLKLSFMQSVIQKRAPIALDGIWITNQEYRIANNTYNIELRGDGELHIPFYRTNQLSRYPLYSFPSLWNKLPPEISIIRNKYEFKSKLKLTLMQQIPDENICRRLYCPSCNLLNNSNNNEDT